MTKIQATGKFAPDGGEMVMEYKMETIEMMKIYDQIFKQLKVDPINFLFPFYVIKVLEVLDLRLRRLEDHLGIPVPDDLKPVRERLK